MKNLLIIGGCHVVDDVFVRNIKNHYQYINVRKLYTHLDQENFNRCLDLLVREKNYFQSKDYEIYLQLGNLLFRNSISHILPQYFKKRFLTNINHFLNSDLKSDLLSRNNYKTFIKESLRKIVKVIIFPFNFLYILIMGFTAFLKVKKILKINSYNKCRIIVFTPFDSPNYFDKLFIYLGKKIIYFLFSDVNFVQIVDSSSFNYDKQNYIDNDIYHLNKNGIALFSNFCIDMIDNYEY
jgi:hypothetical protein